MEHRPLEITLQHAKDLNKVNLITAMDVYAVVSVSGDTSNSTQKTKSPTNHDGDANPTWDFPMKFTLDEAALQSNLLTLDFKLVCERALGDKDVGEVHVPLKELLDSKNSAADAKNSVSYQVRKPSGRPKGQLTFSYKFGEKTAAAAHVAAYPAGPSSVYPPPATYPGPEGSGHYPPPATYPGVEGGGHYPPPYPAAEGSGIYPPPAPYPAAEQHKPPVGYPAAEGSGQYKPPAGYPPPAAGGYPHASPSGYGYPAPPQAGYGYPPAPGYGYPAPPPAGYGYPATAQPGYGYPPPVVKPAKKNKFGLGLGAGLLGGAIGGLLVGDMISDVADFDVGGFDF